MTFFRLWVHMSKEHQNVVTKHKLTCMIFLFQVATASEMKKIMKISTIETWKHHLSAVFKRSSPGYPVSNHWYYVLWSSSVRWVKRQGMCFLNKYISTVFWLVFDVWISKWATYCNVVSHEWNMTWAGSGIRMSTGHHHTKLGVVQ